MKIEELNKLIEQFKDEKLPDHDSPFHFEAEIWSGLQSFKIWATNKLSNGV
jgi:hypothetical protein